MQAGRGWAVIRTTRDLHLAVSVSEPLEGESKRSVFRLLLVLAAIGLMMLPFITTFNEFLTRLVESIGLNVVLRDWVVPTETKMICVLLDMQGIPCQVSTSTIYLDRGGFILPVYISWNCVGWQSFILYGFTLTTGLQGPFTRLSKVETFAVGLMGTFLVNLLRMTSVAGVAYGFGQLPAVIYHDYGGTLIILLWLFAFWWFSHGWLLEPADVPADVEHPERTLREVRGGARLNAASSKERAT